ncbi:MAG: glycosyltransferase [Clostridia bacterium]|nr:glycosyltransferase [Clostridia bacterium]
MALYRRIVTYVRMHGGWYTLRRGWQMLSQRLLRSYDRVWQQERTPQPELDMQRAHQPEGGLISIAVPVYNTNPVYLRELAESLSRQTYAQWEAVLYDGCSTNADTVAALDAIRDVRIRVIHGTENAGISGNTNLAIAACRGAYIALCDHDDTLAPDALWHIAEVIADGAPDMIYTDEDKLTEDGRLHIDPHDKPDFCPDNLRSGNYVCHLMALRREVLERAGGLRPVCDGSQDHDLALRVSEMTDRIVHIPRILYHWRRLTTSMSQKNLDRCLAAAARAVQEHMARIGYPGKCTVEDGVLRLRYDVDESLNVRTILVSDADRYAFMNREAASAEEDVLLFLDESVTGLTEDFIRELLMYAQRRDVGAVTPMLTDQRGRVTHAGFALRKGRAVCRNEGLPWHAGGWHGLNRTSHNVAAVSAACFMIRRDHFIPFETDMIDWCLALSRRGYVHVYTPHARAVCEKRELLAGACEDVHDPCYSVHHDDRGQFTHSQ